MITVRGKVKKEFYENIIEKLDDSTRRDIARHLHILEELRKESLEFSGISHLDRSEDGKKL